MKPLRILLFPFAILYDVVTSIRNILYERGYKPSTSFDIAVIGIGNLAVGGTGKTPMVEYLVRLFSDSLRVVTLSRGYGRATRGFILADAKATPRTIGDEPYQIFRKFGSRIDVAVGEERALAISYILQEKEEVDVILLDDAFQHRSVRPSFQIMLTDYNNLFYNDVLLPAGRLRESSRGAVRADAIVVTKCPDELKEAEMMEIERNIRNYSSKPVFFSKIRYGLPLALNSASKLPERVILLSGVASATSFVRYATARFEVVKHFEFNDHHHYTESNLKEVRSFAEKNAAAILTTEKDAVKLDAPAFASFFGNIPMFYLPIETEFIKNGKDFDEMLLNRVKK